MPPLGGSDHCARQELDGVNFPDAVCDDGSATGIGVSLNPASKDLLIFCKVAGLLGLRQLRGVKYVDARPIRRVSVQLTKLLFVIGSILDRNAKSSFQDMNMVYVPYCTGDVHTGDNVMTYDGGATKARHPSQRKTQSDCLLKADRSDGSEAWKTGGDWQQRGGFGSSLNYDLVRAFFPQAKSYL